MCVHACVCVCGSFLKTFRQLRVGTSTKEIILLGNCKTSYPGKHTLEEKTKTRVQVFNYYKNNFHKDAFSEYEALESSLDDGMLAPPSPKLSEVCKSPDVY